MLWRQKNWNLVQRKGKEDVEKEKQEKKKTTNASNSSIEKNELSTGTGWMKLILPDVPDCINITS